MRYVSYNIHINGTYHCSARYSQLGTLHAALKREFGAAAVGYFPSKKFFYISPEASDDRRHQLQVFLQTIAQTPAIITGSTFQTFLLNAQKEVQRGPEVEAQLDVYLCNGKSVKVDITSTDQTDDVLEAVRCVTISSHSLFAFKISSHSFFALKISSFSHGLVFYFNFMFVWLWIVVSFVAFSMNGRRQTHYRFQPI